MTYINYIYNTENIYVNKQNYKQHLSYVYYIFIIIIDFISNRKVEVISHLKELKNCIKCFKLSVDRRFLYLFLNHWYLIHKIHIFYE